MRPRATYRIQFGKQFGFDDAAAVAPYLARLGVSHVYCSPYLQARPGSEHGYDITDHNALNPELGNAGAFRRMLASFRANNLEHILDYVPNHMGVGGSDNPYWLDVLEWGEDSPYSTWFDIDWNSHYEDRSRKILVPFLADQYGVELESGKLELRFDAEKGEFSVWAYDTHKLPISPLTYAEILGNETIQLERLADAFSALRRGRPEARRQSADLKARLAELTGQSDGLRLLLHARMKHFRGIPGNLDSWESLNTLVSEQNWRAAHFRVAADDINYRRFFNISGLAGIRMEWPEVFETAHGLVLGLIESGDLQGLRIDHVDGLYDPKEYLERLRKRTGAACYLVVEKILSGHESLPGDWPVEGTTGYEFCKQVTGLLIDPTAEKPLTTFYEEFTGEWQSLNEIVRDAKIKIMENEMASELESISRYALRIARQNPCTTDFTQNILRRAIKQVIACFPIYRTYLDGSRREESDGRYVHWAIAQASKNEVEVDASVFDFLEKLLSGRLVEKNKSGYSRHSVIDFVMKVQQFSGPVMAKGSEDTAFYRYNRFLALNEVGASPDLFGMTVANFHKANQERAENLLHTMLATSTHDTKHGEDARARLAALSLVPEEWAVQVKMWSRLLRARRGDVEGTGPPARDDEYALFQNLVATWPPDLTLPFPLKKNILREYGSRLADATTKSLREARIRSNWTSPDLEYERSVAGFIAEALDPDNSATFLENFLPFQLRIAQMGAHNSLVQLVLKLTSPGVADLYQGSELWDLNLCDPDNRRPVDFAQRQALLEKMNELEGKKRVCRVKDLYKNWHSGAIKLAVLSQILKYRRDNSELFDEGAYEPLIVQEGSGNQVCAYLRRAETQCCIVAVALDARSQSQEYSGLAIPDRSKLPITQWEDLLTFRRIIPEAGVIPLAEVFADLPFALLIPAIDCDFSA
jgi:(1->4)-alpha-D-glucan 1-alpha-D-glucosylmutase